MNPVHRGRGPERGGHSQARRRSDGARRPAPGGEQLFLRKRMSVQALEYKRRFYFCLENNTVSVCITECTGMLSDIHGTSIGIAPVMLTEVRLLGPSNGRYTCRALPRCIDTTRYSTTAVTSLQQIQDKTRYSLPQPRLGVYR